MKTQKTYVSDAFQNKACGKNLLICEISDKGEE